MTEKNRPKTTIHSDVCAGTDGWLDPMLREMNSGSQAAVAGAWILHNELELDNFFTRKEDAAI
ncbi:MAG: hypothetical protein R6X08_09905 [Desulfosalsimonadaceae bacterium]